MNKKATKIKRVKFNKYSPHIVKKSTITRGGQFPLNPGQTDRISFTAELGDNNEITKISNVSYEITMEEEWEWIVRYDDHGGREGLHRHQRISLKDQSDFKLPKEIKVTGSKQELLNWAISDIKRNYIAFRQKFLKRNGLDLY
jgi:hypothetical protein